MPPTSSTYRNFAFATYLCGVGAGFTLATFHNVLRATQQHGLPAAREQERALPVPIPVGEFRGRRQRTCGAGGDRDPAYSRQRGDPTPATHAILAGLKAGEAMY